MTWFMPKKIVDLEKPTVLIYGHYDVQPPDPINEWKTDPFSPVIKNGNIFAPRDVRR